MEPLPNHIGKYRIVSRLGRGGMGEVYKAYHPQLQRYVAIKVVLPNSETDPDFIARFENEARVVACLRHPHIVQVFDFDVEANKPYMVMEYVEGETLSERILRHQRSGQLLPLQETARLFTDICSAVDYAHQCGMLHRDLKPANVLINRRNEAILTDFGIAKIAGVSAATMTGMFVGTPHYISPEQAQGLPVDGRSDVYSLSVMLYLLLAGRLPFQSDNPAALIVQRLLNEPVPIEQINPAVPKGLAEVALIGLAKNPDERFRTAGALGHAVATAASSVLAKRGTSESSQPVAALKASQSYSLPASSAAQPELPPRLSLHPIAPSNGLPAQINSAQLLPLNGSQPVAPSARSYPPEVIQHSGGPFTPPPEARPPSGHRPRKPSVRLMISGLLLALLLISGGLLVFALINRSQGQVAPAPVFGTVTFSDSSQQDFKHPANVLTGSFHDLKQPAQGMGDFAWLCDSNASACTLLGPLTVASDGLATLNFTQPDSLLGGRDPTRQVSTLTFEISQEPLAGTASPRAPTSLVYLGHLQDRALVHIRHELGAFSKEGAFANNTTALEVGLGNDALLLQALSQLMQRYQAANNLQGVQLTAEYLLNLLSGATGAQDWDHNGRTQFFQGDDTFGLGASATVNPSTCDGPQDTYLPLVVHHACNTYLADHTPVIQHLLQLVESAGANIVGWVMEIKQIAQKMAAATQPDQITLGDVTTLADRANNILNGSAISDSQKLDGTRQILGYIEQMAQITVGAA